MSNTVVKIVEGEKSFRVNGVEVPFDFLDSLFAFIDAPNDKAIIYEKLVAYLCLIPCIQDQSEHFSQYHKLSDPAKVALALSKPIYKALGLTHKTDRAFMQACMSQLNIEIEHVSNMGDHIFGLCQDESQDNEGFTYEGNVIPFTSKTVN